MSQRLQWRQFSCLIPAGLEPVGDSGDDRSGTLAFSDDRLSLTIQWHKLGKSARPTDREADLPWDPESQTTRRLVDKQPRTFIISARGPKEEAESAVECFERSVDDQIGRELAAWEFAGLAFTAPNEFKVFEWRVEVGSTTLVLKSKFNRCVAQNFAPWIWAPIHGNMAAYVESTHLEVGGSLVWENEFQARIDIPRRRTIAIRQDSEEFIHLLSVWYGGVWRKDGVFQTQFLVS